MEKEGRGRETQQERETLSMEGNGRKDTDFCVIKIQELTGSRSIWKCSGKGGLPPNITFHLKKKWCKTRG